MVEISKEDRLLRSLVENMARRNPAPLELINEIMRLKSLGHSINAISKKLDVDYQMISGLIALKRSGEERLLEAAVKGKVPLGVVMDIAKIEDAQMQRELLKAYEGKQLNQFSIRAVKKLMDQRRFFGKQRGSVGANPRNNRTSADSLVNAYRRGESQRQKLMIKKPPRL